MLESTSPPRTTETVVIPLAVPEGMVVGQDVFVAHCPERVLPGRILLEAVQNDRVVGGMTPACAAKATEFYKTFVNGAVLATTATTAEVTKLVENSYRDVNIALANELSMLADDLKVDVWEVISLANRHPRVNILSPGPGVGGHCISVDPWFLVHAAPKRSRLIRTAREVNDFKPRYVIGVRPGKPNGLGTRSSAPRKSGRTTRASRGGFRTTTPTRGSSSGGRGSPRAGSCTRSSTCGTVSTSRRGFPSGRSTSRPARSASGPSSIDRTSCSRRFLSTPRSRWPAARCMR